MSQIVQGSARWGGRRRRLVLAATVITAVVGAALVAAPVMPASAAPERGADCGTASDTPPARALAPGEHCDGSLHLEPNRVDPHCATAEPCRLDRYTFHAERDHAVAVWFGDSCGGDVTAHTDSTEDFRRVQHGYYFAAPFTGLHTIHVHVPARGCDVPLYSIRAESFENRRPEVTAHGEVPVAVKPGDSITVAVAGRDVDGDLHQTGVELAAAGATPDPMRADWNQVDVVTGSATHTVMVTNAVEVWAHAQDAVSAKAVPVRAGAVALVEDDCGTGADIGTHRLALGERCRAYLAGDLDDHRDTFTVEVPPGVAQVAVRLDPVTPTLVAEATLESPSGEVITAAVPGPVALAEPGTWTVHVDRVAAAGSGTTSGLDVSAGAYDVALLPFAGPGPIELTVTPSTVVTHPGEPVQLDIVATHPDGFPVAVDVRWSDGPAQRLPGAGWSPSGAPQRHTRVLDVVPWQQRTVTVTASDEWGEHGRTATASLTIDVVGPDDRCAGAPRHRTDAPAVQRDWSPEDTDRFQVRPVPAAACDGDLGYRPSPGAGFETVDVVRVELCGPATVCDDGARYHADAAETLDVAVSATGGLSADVTIHALTYDDDQYPYGPADTNEDVDDLQDLRAHECDAYEEFAGQHHPPTAGVIELACERTGVALDRSRTRQDLRTSAPQWTFRVDSGTTRSFTVPAEPGGIYAIEIERRGSTRGTYRLEVRHAAQASPGFE